MSENTFNACLGLAQNYCPAIISLDWAPFRGVSVTSVPLLSSDLICWQLFPSKLILFTWSGCEMLTQTPVRLRDGAAVGGAASASAAFGHVSGNQIFRSWNPARQRAFHLLQLAVLLLDAFCCDHVCQWLLKEWNIYINYTPFSFFIPTAENLPFTLFASWLSLPVTTFPQIFEGLRHVAMNYLHGAVGEVGGNSPWVQSITRACGGTMSSCPERRWASPLARGTPAKLSITVLFNISAS